MSNNTLDRFQLKELEKLCARIPPEKATHIKVTNILPKAFENSTMGFLIGPDTLPVIKAYIELLEEKMKG